MPLFKTKDEYLDDPLRPILGAPIVLSEPARKALEYLNTEENNSFYYMFEYGPVNGVKNPKVVMTTNRACHAEMSQYKEAKAIWSKNPKAGHKQAVPKKVQEAWTEWLLKRSPWSKIPIQTTVEFALKKGFVIQDMDIPANYLVNFLIATRMPCEHGEHVNRWYKFTKAGVPENVAFILGCFTNDKGQSICPNYGHHPFDSGCFHMTAVENFVKGEIARPNQPYSKSPLYYPCNSVWYKEKGTDFELYIKERYHKLIPKQSKDTRIFKVNNEETKYQFTFDQWVEIGKLEHKRITGL